MYDEKSASRDEFENSSEPEYRLNTVPTDHNIQLEDEARRTTLYEPLPTPKKVHVINLWYWIRLPFSFTFFVAAFWLALNFSSLLNSDDYDEWFRNWSSNTQKSWAGYFGTGQLATFDGLVADKNDWVGLNAANEPKEIFESQLVPFDIEGELPLVIIRIDSAYIEGQCAALIGDYLTYSKLEEVETFADNKVAWELFALHAYRAAEKLDCRIPDLPLLDETLPANSPIQED